MDNTAVCHGVHLFGHFLPPFTVPRGGTLAVRCNWSVPRVQDACLLFCEALSGNAHIDGIDVFKDFEITHPYLRAQAWNATNITLSYKDKVTELLRMKKITHKYNLYNITNVIESSINNNDDFVFSFMGLGYTSRIHIRSLIISKPSHLSVIAIDCATTNFSFNEFMPGIDYINID
jgi:hypothetical protein